MLLNGFVQLFSYPLHGTLIKNYLNDFVGEKQLKPEVELKSFIADVNLKRERDRETDREREREKEREKGR